MNIFVHGNGHAGMSEDLRQTFNIETKLHATSCKGVEPPTAEQIELAERILERILIKAEE